VYILFPSDPLTSTTVDSAFAAEWHAARAAGFDTLLLNAEALDAGEVGRAIRACSQAEQVRSALYRGWMLTAQAYADLHAALAERHWHLCNSAAGYRHTHHLPESYSVICEHTPNSLLKNSGRSILERRYCDF
jgi:hypothetical protein